MNAHAGDRAVGLRAVDLRAVPGRRRAGLRRGALPAAVVVLAFGSWGAVRAEDGAVPTPCRPHPVHVVNPGCLPSAVAAVAGAVEGLVAQETTYPNLVPDVTEVYIERPFVSFDPDTGTFTFGPPRLRFDTFAQNLGTVAVDLVSEEATDLQSPSVSQCVSWSADVVCRERRPVGGFHLHHTHGHFHFEDFAKYELRALLADGSVDWTPTGLLGASDKVSFCLLDSRAVRPDARPVPMYVMCSSVREGISPGWADIYTADLPGQAIELGDLPDGRYALVVEMDYADHLFESDNTDNRVVVTLEVTNDRHDVAIVGREHA